jgi:acyl-CoA thioesterase I
VIFQIFRPFLAIGLLVLGVNFVLIDDARAETILAIGASNAGGHGVGAEQAWPAQLERLLRAKGYRVTVVVSSVSGDTSSGILSRVDSAMPNGTRVVVFDSGVFNDRRRGIPMTETASNIAQLRNHVRAHGAVAIATNYAGIPTQGDGIHSTGAGHSAVAVRLLPQVIAVLHRGR